MSDNPYREKTIEKLKRKDEIIKDWLFVSKIKEFYTEEIVHKYIAEQGKHQSVMYTLNSMYRNNKPAK